MRRTVVLVMVVAGATTLPLWSAGGNGQVANLSALVCRHDGAALQQDRARRAQALVLARAINAAQGTLVGQTRRYQPLAQIATLPKVPDGFTLRFYTDGDGYVFSLKDERDPCHYGIFSDQNGRLYEASPQVPQVAS